MMHPIITLLLLAAALAADFVLAREFYKAAAMKCWPQKRYFWICLLLPPAGWLLVAALPDRGGKSGAAPFVSDELPEL